MKPTSLLTFSLLAMLFISSCTKKPTASFSATPSEPLIGEEVKFNNTSSEGVTYVWDFGDGTSSDEKSPTHVYDTEGNYKVKLTTFSKGRKKWAESFMDIAVQHPVALFTGKLNGTDKFIYSGVDGNTSAYGVSQLAGATKERIYSASVGKYDPGTEHIGVKLGTLVVPGTYTLAEIHPEFHSFVEVAYYPFSAGAAAGVAIFYMDASGMVWSSDAGTADQTGSTFVITYTEDSMSGSTVTERFKAHVNCKLYNGLGGSITITDGILELAFGDI